MKQRILITGGLGFIGRHLARETLRDPAVIVTVVDDLSGCVFEGSMIVEMITADRPGTLELFPESVEQFCASGPGAFDEIYHLASIVGPASVLDRAGFISQSIVRDAYHMIGLAQQSGARLVNISTSETYGGGVNGYCHEETPRVIRGRASARQEYAAAKLAAEIAIENLCRIGELDAVTIRPFNVVGRWQSGRGGFVLPRFVGQALLDLPLTVFGNGQQVRAFTDARDIIPGLILCGRRGQSGTAYNLGNPDNRLTIEALADRVLSITGSSAGKCYVDSKAIFGDQYVEAPDKFPDAARALALGWEPRYELDDTIQDVFQAMRALPPESLVAVAGLASMRAVDHVA